MRSQDHRTRTAVLYTLVALATSAAPLSAADRLRAGQWEFKVTRAGSEPNVFEHCINAEEAAMANGDTKSARAVAEKKALAGNCTITEYAISGNTLSYAMNCSKTSIRAKVTYSGDSSDGDMFSKSEGGPEIVSHVKARRIGDCK